MAPPTTAEPVVLLHDGITYRIPRVPHETDEQAMDRAWWIVHRAPKPGDDVAFQRVWTASLLWSHAKYFSAVYVEGANAEYESK